MRNLYEKALAWGVRRLLSARVASVVWAGVRETSTIADDEDLAGPARRLIPTNARLRDHPERFISNGIPLSEGLGTV